MSMSILHVDMFGTRKFTEVAKDSSEIPLIYNTVSVLVNEGKRFFELLNLRSLEKLESP